MGEAHRWLSGLTPKVGVEGKITMVSEDYEYLPVSDVQCPKCGALGQLTLYSNTGYTLEYAGVCGSQLDAELICGASLILQVTAHLFPVEQT